MSLLKERLEDWAIWWHENRDRGRDLDREREFLKTAVDGLLELVTLIANRVDSGTTERLLWTPRGVTVRGDLRRLD
jgi:hypothetical protein